ncbi:methyl-accepting chemotaxis protein [Modicisalibacter xianhensis]|uniref:Methyl-accepting chemotaxis protein n=1 Tax=Modicisalibacter xianhensis TaxID=442341 RepID=A0A1I3D9H8_9GAMM|nr:methyl-accepting chemotaxis protein [Halomonas xianhensis]SFH83355.1 Methyl-accepting chemotaxis protein [Halomonas xianhensis]
MTSVLHRIPVSRKFLLALVLPVLAMLFFAGNGIVERQRVVSSMDRLQSLTALAQQAGSLIHELQRERGMTAGVLGSGGDNFAIELREQRPITDAQAAALLSRLDTLDTDYLSEDLASQVDVARQRLSATVDLRRRVDKLAVPVAEALSHYTGINAALMDLAGKLSHMVDEADIARRLAAYYQLLEAKDLAGIERALLSNAFAADQMTPPLYRRFMNLIGEEAAFLQGFDTLATPTMRDRYQQALSGPDIERLDGLRELVIERVDQGGFGVDPQQWFDWQTVKIGQLKRVENAVTEEILATAQALRSDARIALWGYVAIAGLASLLTLALTVAIVRAIVGPLKRTLQAITHRGGDLTQRLDVPGSDELSQLYQAFNAATDDTERLVTNIRRSALSIEVASGEIAQGNQDLAQRTEEQSASLVETASSMEQITSTVRHTADNAGQAQSLATEVAGQAQQASGVADQARQAMSHIHTANQEVTAIVAAIDSIAFQTNLLALNASVEAARAGEHGRGFAVVASEVRQLASRSASEAERIRTLIARNVTTIDTGNRLVSTTHETLAEIASRIGQVASLVHDISAAATEQSAGIEQINQAVSQLEEVTQQNAALVEQVAAASKSLDEQAGDMAREVGQFTVSDTLHLAAPRAALPQPTRHSLVTA